MKTSTFTMSRDAKAKWLKALRSGRYKQTEGALADEQGYCCLGVLMRTQGVSRRKLLHLGLPNDTSKGDSWGVKHYLIQQENGLVALTGLNDQEHLTFEQIADLIEQKVPCHD
jgi:hypothetical protein